MIVTDDAPFLVDSLGIVFRRAEIAVHMIVHPVLDVHRDGRGRIVELGANGSDKIHAESWQIYEIDRQTDPAQLEKLQEDIEATLADVHVAVEDWPKMREKAKSVSAELESNPPPLPRMKSAKLAGCSSGWKAGTSCSSATGTTTWSAARPRTS